MWYGILKGFLFFVEACCGLLLVALILMQRAKNEGLGMAFGAEMGESLFGARASNVLVQATVWLTAIFLINTTLLAVLYARGHGNTLGDRLGGSPAATAPAQPGPAVAPGAMADRPAPAIPAADSSMPLSVPSVPPAGLPPVEVPSATVPAPQAGAMADRPVAPAPELPPAQ